MTSLTLPDHLEERCRPLGDAEPAPDGDFVLYWMRTACRAHENPALDVALTVGRAIDRPVFVYHGLSETYPYASDRHHSFILEGARDVQAEMASRGIGYAFHLERPGHRGRHLVTLAEKAALVVTEDMPVDPLRRWTKRLAEATLTPVWAVDTACVVPMRLVGRAYDRAFAFRRATEQLRQERLSRVWQETETDRAAFMPDDLPFEPLDLQTASLPDLVAACAIDHTIGPVPHTKGGSIAGYERWSAFRDQRLQRYGQHRNDAVRTDAVSRMSAYLHYGQVSPFRLAREAADIGGKGVEKFLDELLVWRELSYAWCFHRPDHDRISALPDWALQSLRAHQDDPRPAHPSWETLARGRTGEALWDAAQVSLLIHGELHNNVRMTWGKAFLNWTEGPEDCWQKLVDLNHRYALDGRDPNSYGGLMWCLGLFDRPFDPPRAITGRVRPRPLDAHARRLDVDAYARHTKRPAPSRPPKVGVVGAGIAGLTCARVLVDHGLDVTLFDKGRGPGGRTSRRRAEPFHFDHGAQYFTARDPVFRRYVESWREDGVIDVWQGTTVTIGRNGTEDVVTPDERFVGVPGMTALARHLAKDLEIGTGIEVRGLVRDGQRWRLAARHSFDSESFDLIVLAVPAVQAVSLLGEAPKLADRLKGVGMSPCWAALLGFDERLDLAFDAAWASDSPIGWLARNNSKPGRDQAESWVLHATRDWSEDNLEEEADAILPRLCDAFGVLTGLTLTPAFGAVHRWRYALAHRPLGEAFLFDEDQSLGVCGDWCLAGRVEAAFQSGTALAGRILSRES
ncbi:MAG: FAD-dependent oxidoreductase [Alphaproteobacteria bacterium]|nr:FAD-dependent oxidoreductase [Alphaproteobacteria bacterium]